MGDYPDAYGLGLAELRSALDALRDPEPEVRLAAVRSLVRLGGTRATRALMQSAAGDLSPVVRAEALAALSRILEARGSRVPPPDS